MNNLNDPQDGNLIPGRQADGSGDSSKWNYFPFVSFVGIAAMRMYYTTLLHLKARTPQCNLDDRGGATRVALPTPNSIGL